MRRTERQVLAIVGAFALLGLGVLLWQRQGPALTVVGDPVPAAASRWDAALEASRRVDLNTADVAALERLPEVGPALARRIVEHRTRHGRFRRVEELRQVRGIGPKTFDAIKDHVRVAGGL